MNTKSNEAGNLPKATLVSSEHGFDDYDVEGIPTVHRVAIGHGIRKGNSFNVYCDEGKIGSEWQGTLEKSLEHLAARLATEAAAERKLPQATDDPRLARFWTLAEVALALKNDDSFQSRVAAKEQSAISRLVEVNVEMDQLRQHLNNAGVQVPQMNDVKSEDLAEWKARSVPEKVDDWLPTLAVGDEVFWTDPDDGFCSGYRTIAEIVSDSGKIESDETVVRLNDKGSVTEAFAGELSPHQNGPDYTVTVELSVTADSPEQAAAFALDDLRDLSLGPINFDVNNLASGQVKTVPVDSALTPWERNDIQFPRLLAEILDTQDNLDIKALAESMGLTIEEVNELFDRAGQTWEAIKEETAPLHVPSSPTP